MNITAASFSARVELVDMYLLINIAITHIHDIRNGYISVYKIGICKLFMAHFHKIINATIKVVILIQTSKCFFFVKISLEESLFKRVCPYFGKKLFLTPFSEMYIEYIILNR